MVKTLPVMKETWVRPLGREDTPEKQMAAHSSILAWRIPWTEKPGGPQSMGSEELGTTKPRTLSLSEAKCHMIHKVLQYNSVWK